MHGVLLNLIRLNPSQKVSTRLNPSNSRFPSQNSEISEISEINEISEICSKTFPKSLYTVKCKTAF